MNPLSIIQKYYQPDSKAYHILLTHSKSVMEKALSIAFSHPEMNLDIAFLREAAMLHDIGMFLTHAPGIDCHGDRPYICHGYLGADLLREEGFPHHALVCERHTGSGITIDMIRSRNLPLPAREMVPISLEEKLICFADKFYSKSKELTIEKPIEVIRAEMQKYGQDSITRFEEMYCLFLPL